jgi:hypothetical protein
MVLKSGAACPGDPSGVQLRDDMQIVNHGTYTISPCAYGAGDWGTRFENDGQVNFASALGYYEGFIKSDLPWETNPPQFVNNATITKVGAGTFLLAARYSGPGTIVVPNGGNVVIPDHAASLAAAFRTAPSASAAMGGSCPVQLCSFASSASDPVIGMFQNSASSGAASKVLLSQNPNDATGTKYATTPRPGGSYEWRVTRGSVAFTQTNGRATAGQPNIVTITLDKSLVKGKPVTEFAVGFLGKLLPNCTSGGPVPCVLKTIKNGNVRFVVKTLGPQNTPVRMYPCGPRLPK